MVTHGTPVDDLAPSPPDAASSTLGLLNLALTVVLLLAGSIGIFGKPLPAAVILVAVERFATNASTS
jgi:hypothetical protein